nr:helix-turn-helix domain containing protein [Kineococcus siccus]
MTRDDAIVAAALDALSAHGWGGFTMEAVATRAGVGKGALYRRWSSSAELAADALESVGFVPRDIAYRGESLRDDLVTALVTTSGCSDPHRHRLVAVLLEAARTSPDLAAVLRERYVDRLGQEIVDAAARAAARGEAAPGDVPAGAGDLRVQSAVALVLHLSLLRGSEFRADDASAVVDEVLLPLLRARAAAGAA